MRDQRVRDPVHNLIKFRESSHVDRVLWRLVQTRPFQRLRRIKQLGFSEFVYPGATHSRLSHSLGTMQMAKRMVEILCRNASIGGESDDELWADATVCAALLHDLGHGPYSHVFEDISSKLGTKKHHEDFTKDFIESAEIAEVLTSYSKELFDAVVSFFRSEPGNNAYSRIVSGQLDADRLDFLVRDRYFTGVRFANIDLEWLFDSMRIEPLWEEVGSDIKRFELVVNHKGLQVVEEFLAGYFELYSQVYFHKTTRGVQHLVQDVVLGVLQATEPEKYVGTQDSILAYFRSGATIDAYLQLDDSSVLSFLHKVATSDSEEYAEAAQRYFDRNLYKCFEIPWHPQHLPPRNKIAQFDAAVKASGMPYHRDLVPSKGHKQFSILDQNYFKNILVFSPFDEEPRPVSELSRVVSQLNAQAPVRYYFRSREELCAASDIWKKL